MQVQCRKVWVIRIGWYGYRLVRKVEEERNCLIRIKNASLLLVVFGAGDLKRLIESEDASGVRGMLE